MPHAGRAHADIAPIHKSGASPIVAPAPKLYSTYRTGHETGSSRERNMTTLVVLITGTLVRLVLPFGLLLVAGTLLQRAQGRRIGV